MSPNDPLDDLFDRWRPPSETPDLRPQVRRELSRARAQARSTWFGRLEVAFSRPSFAMTFVAACVLLGLFLAEARVSRQHALYGAQVARNYIQLIDPLLAAETQAQAASKDAK